MSSQNKGRIDALAATLQDWLREKIGMQAPLPEEISAVIEKHLKEFGVALVSDSVTEEKQLPALLKSPEAAKQSRRMRELAGIPHKDNFV